MKWFSLFFSLYFFTLSCFPCNDSEHEHIGQTKGTNSYFSSSNNFPEHKHCEDTCSPFCGCQCCSVIFAFRMIEAVEFQKTSIFDQKSLFPDHCLWLKDVVIGIDHPPQLV